MGSVQPPSGDTGALVKRNSERIRSNHERLLDLLIDVQDAIDPGLGDDWLELQTRVGKMIRRVRDGEVYL